MDSRLPSFSLHGIFQARILEWLPFSSPGDLPNPGIKPRSPALQADSLLMELWEKPHYISGIHRENSVEPKGLISSSNRESWPSLGPLGWEECGHQKLETIVVAVGKGFLAGTRDGLSLRNVDTTNMQEGLFLLSVLSVLFLGTSPFIIVSSSNVLTFLSLWNTPLCL